MTRALRFARVLVGGDSGSTATEYALMASLIAIVVVLAVIFFGESVVDLFDGVASKVSNVA